MLSIPGYAESYIQELLTVKQTVHIMMIIQSYHIVFYSILALME